MPVRTVYRSGDARVTLTGDLERWARSVLSDSTRECVRVAEEALEPVAERARREWYGKNGVAKETGKGGDIQVITTLDATHNVIRVSLGSTDDRKAGKTSKPVAVFQHRPGPNSLVLVSVSREEYWATSPKLRGPYWRGIGGTGERLTEESAKDAKGRVADPRVYKRNPGAGDGKFLLAELVRKPGRAIIKKAIKPAVLEVVKKRIAQGGGS